MTEPTEMRRKRLLFRSWHRGTREADLLLGSFAEHYLGGFDDRQLDAYDRLLGAEDPDLWDWIVGQQDAPPEQDREILRMLQTFRPKVRGA